MKKKIVPGFRISSLLFKAQWLLRCFKGLLIFFRCFGHRKDEASRHQSLFWLHLKTRRQQRLGQRLGQRPGLPPQHWQSVLHTHKPVKGLRCPLGPCLPHPGVQATDNEGSTYPSWRCWGATDGQQWFMSAHLTSCHPGRFLARWLLSLSTRWLDWHNSKNLTLGTGLRVPEMPSVRLLFVAWSLAPSVRLKMCLASKRSTMKCCSTSLKTLSDLLPLALAFEGTEGLNQLPD